MKFKKWYSNQILEYWKDVQDYEGIYMISSLGRVKSLNHNHTGKVKILKPRKDKYGYLKIGIYKNGRMKTFLVHRLVAQAFIPNSENKPEVNHIDENKTNNNVKNLEWMTSKENANHGTRNSRASEKRQGERNPMYGRTGGNSPVARKVKCIETNQIFNTLTEAVEWCGLKSSASIIFCCQGKTKSAGKHPITGQKLTWEYVVEEVEIDLNIIPMSNIIMINI